MQPVYFSKHPLSKLRGITGKGGKRNLAFMWYLGYDVDEPTPDHSVISKARSRYSRQTFEKFFERILDLCVKAGLVTGEKVFADSTLIRANASLNSVVPRSDAFQPSQSPKEHVEQVFTENPVLQEELADAATGSSEAGVAGDQARLFSLSKDRHKEESGEANVLSATIRRGRPAKPKQGYNEQYVLKTDPYASIISRPIIGKGIF